MILEQDWSKVHEELAKRNLTQLYCLTVKNCNLLANVEDREIFYWQFEPKLACWVRFEMDEMDRFYGFCDRVEQNAHSIRDGAHRFKK